MSRNLWILGIAIVLVLPVLAPLALQACGGGACAMHGAAGGSHGGHAHPASPSSQGHEAAAPASGTDRVGVSAPTDQAPASAATVGKKPVRAGKRVSALIYTCPMDPEVRQSAPGQCPKCGMNLESVRPPAVSKQKTSDSGATRN